MTGAQIALLCALGSILYMWIGTKVVSRPDPNVGSGTSGALGAWLVFVMLPGLAVLVASLAMAGVLYFG